MHAVFDALRSHAAKRPDTVAFRDDLGVVTWAGLAGRVTALARRLADAPDTVAIAAPGGIDYVVADLALTLAQRRQVPLPFFFSAEQTAHILQESGAGAVIAADPTPFQNTPLQVTAPDAGIADAAMPAYGGGATRVIYTSGSSGRPKGVVLGDRQMAASLAALYKVLLPQATDRHLSVLPLAQLLEQSCGIFLPILAGAECVMRFAATKALLGGPVKGLLDAMDQAAPTTSLLAPGVLGRWAAVLASQGRNAPESLRFVAVGGAASSPALIHAARAVGVPVHEGYGLSECCAVVAMNPPGDSVPGGVGPVLDGVDVQIINGEITVAGPTVMDGYLNGPPAPARWHTGDMGHFANGRLVIDGRKDALIVTPAGRNISPEWVEQRVNADPRVVASALGLRATDNDLVLVAALAAPMRPDEIAAALCDLPDYARPRHVILTTSAEPGLLFPAGTPNRVTVAAILSTRPALPLNFDLADERQAS